MKDFTIHRNTADRAELHGLRRKVIANICQLHTRSVPAPYLLQVYRHEEMTEKNRGGCEPDKVENHPARTEYSHLQKAADWLHRNPQKQIYQKKQLE